MFLDILKPYRDPDFLCNVKKIPNNRASNRGLSASTLMPIPKEIPLKLFLDMVLGSPRG